MLIDGGCSIYEHRPRTCRMYDCRVFAAAGVDPEKPEVAERVQEWEFTYASESDRDAHDALLAVAARQTGTPTERAVLAVNPCP